MLPQRQAVVRRPWACWASLPQQFLVGALSLLAYSGQDEDVSWW